MRRRDNSDDGFDTIPRFGALDGNAVGVAVGGGGKGANGGKSAAPSFHARRAGGHSSKFARRAGKRGTGSTRRLRLATITARSIRPIPAPFSLQPNAEHDVSLTTTLFLGFRPFASTQIYFDPEIAGGRGFSGVNGVANAPNGELPRVASATPKPYLARLYVTQDFGFGTERENFEATKTNLQDRAP